MEGRDRSIAFLRTYHDRDGLALVSDRDTAATVGAIVPNLFRNAGGPVNPGREGVVDEAAGAVLPAVFLRAGTAVACAQADEDFGGGRRRRGRSGRCRFGHGRRRG